MGQIVGRMGKVRKAKDVVFELVEECIEATERMNTLLAMEEAAGR